MKLLINGKSKNVTDRLTLAQLLEQLDLDPNMVVIELNKEILNAMQRRDKRLCDGDQLEIIQFVGGG